MGLSDEQSQKIAPIAEDLFAEKESLQEIRQTINDEILSQMKSETADAEELEAVLTGSFEQLRAKLPKFTNSFAKFHATLAPEQRAKIVEKIKKRRKRFEKGGWVDIEVVSGIEHLNGRAELHARLMIACRSIFLSQFIEQQA